MSNRVGTVLRVVAPAAVLALLLWRLGAGPFVDGLRTVDTRSTLAAVAITAVTTVCAAWRWKVVARGLGVRLPLRPAVAAYYRSQFLNTALPGGILGDAHRAVDHGHRIGDLGRGVRAVAWERSAGQAVQLVLAAAVLIALPSPVRSVMPLVLVLALGAAAIALCGVVLTPGTGRSRVAATWSRFTGAVRSDVRGALLARGAWPVIGLASLVAVAGHTTVMLIAVHISDPLVPLTRVLPLAVLVLLGSTLPLHVAGWGPREGVAAWAFGAAGLGAAQGVAAATVYGVLVIASCLPGGVVLLVARRRRTHPVPSRQPAEVSVRPEAIHG